MKTVILILSILLFSFNLMSQEADPKSSSLQLLYTFENDVNSRREADVSSHDNHGRLVKAVRVTDGQLFGERSLELKRVDDEDAYVDVGSPNILFNRMTIIAFVKPDSDSHAESRIFGRTQDGTDLNNTDFFLGILNGRLRFRIQNALGEVLTLTHPTGSRRIF
jgi:hypothetical protein